MPTKSDKLSQSVTGRYTCGKRKENNSLKAEASKAFQTEQSPRKSKGDREILGPDLKQIERDSMTTIKNMDAFNKKSKMRLQELINPTGDAVGVFDTGKFLCH